MSVETGNPAEIIADSCQHLVKIIRGDVKMSERGIRGVGINGDVKETGH